MAVVQPQILLLVCITSQAVQAGWHGTSFWHFDAAMHVSGYNVLYKKEQLASECTVTPGTFCL